MSKCHFIGIGGIGMSGLARLVLAKKSAVSGSDIAASPMTDSLANDGAKIMIGHSAQNVTKGSTVVYGTDIKKDNPEYQAALRLGCKLFHRSEFLAKLTQEYQPLAVAGTHGKTTTSSLLAWVLKSCGLSPSYAIGGIVTQLGANSGLGTGSHFVFEACESDGTFLNYSPHGAILTNVDDDHMDHYGTMESMEQAFMQFSKRVASSNHLFWCGDDPRLKNMSLKGFSYGFDPHCHLRGENYRQSDWTGIFDVAFKGKSYKNVEVSLAGRHNALNAMGVLGLTLSLGIDEDAIRGALKTFAGVHRRCEKKGVVNDILFLDDYGHHPTELKATLQAVRNAIGKRRLVVVYQPHRYTRAKQCMGHYKGVFDPVSSLFVTDIYSAGEQPIPGVTHQATVDEVKGDLPGKCFACSRSTVAHELKSYLQPNDVLLTLGAGNITKLSHEVMALLTQTE